MSQPHPRQTLTFNPVDAFRRLCGAGDGNLKAIAKFLEVGITTRGNTILLSGPESNRTVATRTLEELFEVVKQGVPIFPADATRAARIAIDGPAVSLRTVLLDTILITASKKRITPKNLNQKLYVDAIREHGLTFGVGPAGTGKTYLAMAMAVAALQAREVKRIILTRPAVEAGESLGFLPGDLTEKVNPYLRPLYDALYDMMDPARAQRAIDDKTLEVAPLAFMRGRTLNDAFVILDEAQNTTRTQMKMFLTRLGFNSKAVVTGDITQTDLPRARDSGLAHALGILKGVEGIEMQTFKAEDIVRHPLVMRIVRAYAEDGGQA